MAMPIRDRVVGLRRVRASELIPNARNWRTHPLQQRETLRGVLAQIGYADALLARETPRGLELLDGHLRAETTPDMEVPVLIVDLNDEEAALFLTTLDPLAAMAGIDAGALDALLREVQPESEEVQALLASLAQSAGLRSEAAHGEPPFDPGAEWLGMPKFEQEDLSAAYTVSVRFRAKEDLQAFGRLIGQNVTEDTRGVWFPQSEERPHHGKRFVDES